MLPASNQPEIPGMTPSSPGLVSIQPVNPLQGHLLSAHGSWGLAGSLAVHVAAVAAFGGWLAGWMPGWIPPPSGLSSQAQSGDRFTSVAAAPASDPAMELLEAPPVSLEVMPSAELPHLANTSIDASPRAASGRALEVVVPDSPPVPRGVEEATVRHQVEENSIAGKEAVGQPPAPIPQSAMPAARPRALATERPSVSTTASTASAVGSRGQAGAHTNAPPRAVFSPEPIYPPQALAAGQKGKVIVRIRVDANGQVTSARVQGTSGNPFLDEAALIAVRRWRFEARADGATGAVDLAVPIVFDIEKKP